MTPLFTYSISSPLSPRAVRDRLRASATPDSVIRWAMLTESVRSDLWKPRHKPVFRGHIDDRGFVLRPVPKAGAGLAVAFGTVQPVGSGSEIALTIRPSLPAVIAYVVWFLYLFSWTVGEFGLGGVEIVLYLALTIGVMYGLLAWGVHSIRAKVVETLAAQLGGQTAEVRQAVAG